MLTVGQIVLSKSGHDKHRFYVVVEASLQQVVLVDGKRRPLEAPKKKNLKHVSPTQKYVNLAEYSTNRSIRRMLEPMNQSLKQGTNRQGGN